MSLRWISGRRLPCPRLPHFRSYSYAHKPKPKAPHLLGPCWNWRMCYRVHPACGIRIPRPLEKYQWLTKSSVICSLPEDIQSKPPFSSEYIDDFRLRATEFFAKQEHRKKHGFTSLEVTDGLFQSLLPTAWTLGSEFPHLLKSSLAHKPKVEAFWKRCGFNFHCTAHPSYILHSDTALELFHPDVHFKGNESIPIGFFHPKSMDLYLRGFNQIRPFCGYKRGSSFTFCHTVLVADSNSKSREYFLAHGLMSLFSQSVAQALQYGYKLGKDLEVPLVTQGIVTNGRKFTFVCFQLNTLDMEHDMGTWNVFWSGPTLDLFEKTHKQELVGFSEECSQLFLKFMTNAPTRSNPKQTGFSIAYLEKKALEQQETEKKLLWEKRLKAEDQRRLQRKDNMMSLS